MVYYTVRGFDDNDNVKDIAIFLSKDVAILNSMIMKKRYSKITISKKKHNYYYSTPYSDEEYVINYTPSNSEEYIIKEISELLFK